MNILPIIQTIEHLRERPHVYVDSTLAPEINFMNGIISALTILGVLPNYSESINQVMKEHGWEITPLGPLKQMIDLGYSAEQITRELIDMEIEALKRWLMFRISVIGIQWQHGLSNQPPHK